MMCDSLAALLARLVSEERPERRDDGNESGIHEVLDHCLDVFVGGGRFFVEQLALFADHAATERGLDEFAHGEAFAHARAAFAARPLATGAVCEGPRVAFAIARWLHEVTQGSA